jgi:tetratricopeptide (TPR) repeat protein
LKIGENEPETADSADNPDWMRWNNLGIALLDQSQYQESVEAFTEVVKLRPLYVDAYTNIGLTETAWEKYALRRVRPFAKRSLSIPKTLGRSTTMVC